MIVLWPAPARADLMGDAQALLSSWRRSGAAPSRVTTVFLEAEETRRIAVGKRKDSCVKVVAIAERQIAFTLRLPTRVIESRGGVAQLDDCGTLKGHIALGMTSPRGSIELLMAHYRGSIAPVETVLPERALGPAAPPGSAGEPLELAPIAERVARAERVAMSEGASGVVPVRTRAGQRGSGVLSIKLAEGCHRLNVLADGEGHKWPIDIDAEVSLPDDFVRRDRSQAPDARLDFCLGESARVELRYVGAGGPLSIMVIDAFWTLPKGIPSTWGNRVRAAFASALQRRHAPKLEQAPAEQRLGVAGVTVVPFEVEASSCYLAAFASVQAAGAGRLTVRAGSVVRYDDATEEPLGAAVSFCVPSETSTARVQIELGAQSASWVLALWRLTP